MYQDELAPEQEGWLERLRGMLTLYFVREQRGSVRQRALEAARALFDRYQHFYAAEVAEAAVLRFLPTIALDPDATVRATGLQLVVHVARSMRESRTFVDLCAILHGATMAPAVEAEARLAAVKGLASLLHDKVTHHRFDHVLLLLDQLRSALASDDVAVRRLVLGELLQLRATPRYHLQLANHTSAYIRLAPPAASRVHQESLALGLYAMQPLLDDLAQRLVDEDRLEVRPVLPAGVSSADWRFCSCSPRSSAVCSSSCSIGLSSTALTRPLSFSSSVASSPQATLLPVPWPPRPSYLNMLSPPAHQVLGSHSRCSP